MKKDEKPPCNTDPRSTNLHVRVLLRPLRKDPAAFSIIETLTLFPVLSNPKLEGSFVDKPSTSTDRRHSRRFIARLEAELVVSLSLLDAAAIGDETLLLMGETKDISADGLSVVVPSIRIDEMYCEQARPLTLSLHLQKESVKLEVQTIHCTPLRTNDPDRGYLIGARITDFGGLGPLAWRRYLRGLQE